MKKDIYVLDLDTPKSSIIATATEILKKHNLDFHIHKLPLGSTHINSNGDEVKLQTPYYGLYRGDTGACLNAVKEGYTVSQNQEIVELALRGIEGYGNLSVYKAGSLFGGKRVYIQLEIDGFAKVANDNIKKYITIIDSNDGSTGLSVGIGDLTMSCQNQFFRFYKAGMKFKHSASIEAKMKEIPNLITLALSEQMKLINAYNTFAKTPAHKGLVDKLVKELVGMDRAESLTKEKVTTKAINNMENLYTHISKEMADKGNNCWGLHSGVTSWTTHQKQAPSRDGGRIEGIMVPSGTNYKTNQQSLNFMLAEAGIKL